MLTCILCSSKKNSVLLKFKLYFFEYRWRSTSLFNFVKPRKKSNSSILSSRQSVSSQDEVFSDNSSVSTLSLVPRPIERQLSSSKENQNLTVTIVLVKAKCLPPIPNDAETHSLYCKFRLGSEIHKTKSVPNTAEPEWRERFKLHIYKDDLLKISVCDKGKQKNHMGSCVLDLSTFEKERTHELWQQLDDGYGLIHLSVTICMSRSNNSPQIPLYALDDFQQRHTVYNLRANWKLVGLLHVKIISARGLIGKPNAYCTLELDNERVQTPKEASGSEPTWNKCYVFNVYDVTSTIDLKVYDSSLTTLLNESLGKVSIPLLRITNGQQRWYALKDKNRKIAKGNFPRVCLQMTLIWNPIKASMKLFRPRRLKHIRKPPKFDIALVYSNLEFIEVVFNFLYEANEGYKRLFEWDDPESSFIALVGWLVFCSYLCLWTVPLLLLLPFFYNWFYSRHQDNRYHIMRPYSNPSDGATKISNSKEDKGLTGKIQDIQKMTLTITNGVEYIASLAERLYNLASFKVPFLSYLAMMILVISSLVLYFIPFNYLLMSLGIYKFTRKYLNPDRVLNNDLLDFISRIPDNEILKDWKELSVPEPVERQSSGKLARSIST
ncbi:multiple C2 and transmembrane domain-containing protein-like isoform X2 [Epargyreus clarus]|uniref:multiple C2 and transmembrane domain-containing protein-like isoform X2 n=1 Tax=Epargyreus clarus TaxID=520877 RepID=UPI003C2BE8C6